MPAGPGQEASHGMVTAREIRHEGEGEHAVKHCPHCRAYHVISRPCTHESCDGCVPRDVL